MIEVEAGSAGEAVDLVYEGVIPVRWDQQGVIELDAVRMLAIDEEQQLQVLRDRGWLAFNGRGTYRRV